MNPLLVLWKRLLQDLRLQRPSERFFELNEELLQPLQELAKREQRSSEEVANDLLSLGISQRRKADQALKLWKALSPREQQTVALVCLGYPTADIARRMSISPETVKAHTLSAVHKFNLRNKSELRQVLDGWDFSGWDR